jgi:hypothetical protein
LPFTKQNFALWRQLKRVEIIFHCIPIGEKIDFFSLLSTTRGIFKKQRTNIPKYGELSSKKYSMIIHVYLSFYLIACVLLLFASIRIFWYYLHTCYKVVGINMDLKLFHWTI